MIKVKTYLKVSVYLWGTERGLMGDVASLLKRAIVYSTSLFHALLLLSLVG